MTQILSEFETIEPIEKPKCLINKEQIYDYETFVDNFIKRNDYEINYYRKQSTMGNQIKQQMM